MELFNVHSKIYHAIVEALKSNKCVHVCLNVFYKLHKLKCVCKLLA